jgi:hypothetical protein
MGKQRGSAWESYLRLLDLCYEVAQSLMGTRASIPHMPDCQQLAAKLFFHAASIYWLGQGTHAPVPISVRGGAYFYDFASIAVLTRAVLETYLTLFEVFLEPETLDEFEFNHALWQLSGFVVREGFVPSDPSMTEWVVRSRREIEEMRSRLCSTKKYLLLSARAKKAARRGRRSRDWSAVARAAGFGEETIQKMYAYYSGYVHSNGLAGAQIMQAATREEQSRFIEGHMHLVMSILAKTVLGYEGKFREARRICEGRPADYTLAQVWSGAANLLP